MALNRIPCPECGAGLKSPSGFKVGQNVCCPKCETYFTVEEPPVEDEEVEEKEIPKKKQAATSSSKAKTAGKKPLKAAALRDDDDEDEDQDDEDDDRPKKKKKKRRDDSERSYKNSPLRFVILGVLVITMLVLGYLLYDKFKKQRAADEEFTKAESATSTSAPVRPMPGVKGGPAVRQVQGGAANIQPNPAGQFPNQPNQNGPTVAGGLFGPDPLSEVEKKKLLEKYKAQLIGTWKADLGGGVTVQLVYGADGKASATVTNSGKTETYSTFWSPSGEVTRRGLTVVAFAGTKFSGGNKPMQLIFEDDELQHPVFDPVSKETVIGIFRKV